MLSMASILQSNSCMMSRGAPADAATVFLADNTFLHVEHKLRNIIVEVVHRLPQNESLRPYVPELLRLVLATIQSDNEENALVR